MGGEYHIIYEKARQQYDMAFHLLHGTYPFTRDQKLLLGIVMNLATSTEKAMDSLLAYEKELKLLPPAAENFASRLDILRRKTAPRQNIHPDLVNLIPKLREYVVAHQTSPVEFRRGEKLVICNDHYQMQTLSIKDVQDYAQQTKLLLDATHKIITNLERKQ